MTVNARAVEYVFPIIQIHYVYRYTVNNKYQKRIVYTRGETLTDLNKNINISIIDNHNESKSRWILFKMACSYIACAYMYINTERDR